MLHLRRYPILRVASIIAALSLIASDFVINMETVDAYSCFGNHCRATARWVGGTPGAYTQINFTGMSYSGPGTEIINNEMWLIDYSSDGCYNNPYTGCWVKAGVQASQDMTYMHFFWAGVQPGGAYREQPLSMATPGTNSNLFLVLEAAQDYSHWLISMVSPTQSFTYSITRDWGAGVMYPNVIDIGEELSGASGGRSEIAYWFANEWRDPPGN